MSDNAYSFTSTYKDYLIKKVYNFSKIDQYFDRKNFIFNCKLYLLDKKIIRIIIFLIKNKNTEYVL